MKNIIEYNDTQKYHSLIIPDIPNEYFLDTDQYDSIYIAQRYILLAIEKAISGNNVSITLYENNETKELLNIYLELFPDFLKRVNIIFIPECYYKISEFLTGENINWEEYVSSHGKEVSIINEELSYQIKKNIHKIINLDLEILNIRGYKVTQGIVKVSNFIKDMKKNIEVLISGFNDSNSIYLSYGKSILHEDLDEYKKVKFSEKITNKIPKGIYIRESDGIEGMKLSITKLKNKLVNKFIIKPILASSGEGIIIIDENLEKDEIENYNFSYGDIIIEECLDLLKLNEIGIKDYGNDPLSLSVQFFNGKIEGNPLLQLTKNNEFQGGVTMSNKDFEKIGLSETIINEIIDYSETLIKEMNLTGNGGFDFLFDQNYNFYFVDPNIGRDTGALPIRIFEKINKDSLNGKTTIFTKINSSKIFNLIEFIKFLNKKGINTFNSNTGTGIMPISFVKGKHLTIILSGNNFDEVNKILEEIIIIANLKKFGDSKINERKIKIGTKFLPYSNINSNLGK